MGAGADRGAGDVDDAVEVIAQEGRDPQGPRELVRRAYRDAADYQALRAQDEERARAGGEGLGERAADDAPKGADAALGHLAGQERGVADEVRDEGRRRARVQVAGPALLGDAAVPHDRDAV